MTDFKYTFKKGEFNKFNNVNQDMKHLFTRYTLYNNIVIGDNVDEYGKHFAKVDYKLPNLPDNILITIDSAKLFDTQKEHKKNIIGYSIINEELFLTMQGMDDIQIGHARDVNGLATTKLKLELKEAKEFIDTPRQYIKLTDEDMENLLEFKTKIVIKSGPFKVFITKDTVPNIKKSDYVDVSFSKTNNSTVFQMIIRICRGGTTITHHVYRCLYM